MVLTRVLVVRLPHDTFAQVKRDHVRAQRLLEGVEPMGRGRQKAKQMKVARKLKYFSPDTDLHALQRELADEDSYLAHVPADEPEEDDAIDDDLYSKYADFAEMPAEEDDIDPELLDESFWTGGSSTNK